MHYITEHTIVHSQRDFSSFTNSTQQTVVSIKAGSTKGNSKQYNVFVLSEKPVASWFMNNYAFNFLSMDLYRFVRVTRLRLDTDGCDDVVTWSSLCSLSWCPVCDSVLVLFVSNDRTKSNCKLWNFN